MLQPVADSVVDFGPDRPMATMRPSKDPAMMRVGVNLGSAEEEEKAAKVAVTMHETMVRTLNLVRLAAWSAVVGLGRAVHVEHGSRQTCQKRTLLRDR